MTQIGGLRKTQGGCAAMRLTVGATRVRNLTVPHTSGRTVHIPDGYLSPETCVAACAVAAPFWYVAVRRVKTNVQSKAVPLLAVTSAFSFVVMMFNLPVPGGTTAHAVGMGIAAIVLGVWPAILAVSIALFIQALFFGDGGLTSFGANSLNMAVLGCLVAYGVYRLVAAKAPLDSPRRVLAAALGGYVGINAAALLAAVEFGIQPLLFRDATGAPLYAPYPLEVAVPAMAFAHLTIAGAAEAIVTGGIVAYLQRANPPLLLATSGLAGRDEATAPSWWSTRWLWAGLGGLMILSPLGLVAAGIAWGEWGAGDFADPAVRDQISQASGNVAPPAQVPAGLEQLSSIWTAPIPDYAPAFMHDERFGYIVSAVIGSGLILLVVVAVSWIVGRFGRNAASAA